MLLVPEVRVYVAPWLESNEILHPYYSPCGCPQSEASEKREQQRQREFAQQQAQKTREKALERAGLVGWLAGATFKTFRQRDNWREATSRRVQVQSFADAVIQGTTGDRPWLVLHGEYGTGKSHLAAAAIHEALAAGMPGVYFRPWTQYLKRLQASWDRDEHGERTSDIIAELQKGRFVAIDDIDKRQDKTGWARDELYTVLNFRYNRLLPTILTFNTGLTDRQFKGGPVILQQFLSRAILDRIIGSAWKIVDFDGPSYRSGVKW